MERKPNWGNLTEFSGLSKYRGQLSSRKGSVPQMRDAKESFLGQAWGGRIGELRN
jgi:hypothetical protein